MKTAGCCLATYVTMVLDINVAQMKAKWKLKSVLNCMNAKIYYVQPQRHFGSLKQGSRSLIITSQRNYFKKFKQAVWWSDIRTETFQICYHHEIIKAFYSPYLSLLPFYYIFSARLERYFHHFLFPNRWISNRFFLLPKKPPATTKYGWFIKMNKK